MSAKNHSRHKEEYLVLEECSKMKIVLEVTFLLLVEEWNVASKTIFIL